MFTLVYQELVNELKFYRAIGRHGKLPVMQLIQFFVPVYFYDENISVLSKQALLDVGVPLIAGGNTLYVPDVLGIDLFFLVQYLHQNHANLGIFVVFLL